MLRSSPGEIHAGVPTRSLAILIVFLAAMPSYGKGPEDADTSSVRWISPSEAVDRSYRTEYPLPLIERANPSDVILKLDVLDTLVEAGKPFRIILRVYDGQARPIPTFDDAVTYECINGVTPVLSQRKWRHASLEDTIIVIRPGRNIRLTAMTSRALAALHLDVLSEIPTKQTWLEIADKNIANRDFDRAIDALKTAGRFDPEPDPEVERKIAGLYLKQGKWKEAEEHYQRAIRAVIGDLRFAD